MTTDMTTQTIDTDDLPDRIETTITIDEALSGHDPDDFDEETVAEFIDLEKQWTRDDALRDLARELFDPDSVPEATSLLWIDRAEVYALCAEHYHENRDGAWTGSTQNPDYEQLREAMQERLAEGTPCANCKSEAIRELASDLAAHVDVEVTVDE